MPLICLGLLVVTALAALVTRAWMRRGWHLALTGAGLALVGLVAVLWYLAGTASGHYLAGLEQALLAIAIVIGPLAGIVIGLVLSRSWKLGLGLGLIYAAGVIVLCVNLL